jgi:predicted nucleotidyltransferase component of viral defense system
MFDIDKHKNILVRILKDIYSDTKLSPALGFKGGTAAFLFYNLNRFSVDLDFDLLNKEKEDYVFKKIEKILKKYGTLKDKQVKKFNLFYFLSYEEKAVNIKVEINRREFGSQYEIKSYLGIPMKVMVRKDMFAHKLVAMYERIGKANRDIFDVWFFSKNDWSINKNIIEKRTNLSFDKFLNKCISTLKDLPNRSILKGLGEVLDEKQKIWAKRHLKEDVIFNLKLMRKNGKK